MHPVIDCSSEPVEQRFQVLISVMHSSIFHLSPLNTGLCEHALAYRILLHYCVSLLSFKHLLVFSAVHESGTVANVL